MDETIGEILCNTQTWSHGRTEKPWNNEQTLDQASSNLNKHRVLDVKVRSRLTHTLWARKWTLTLSVPASGRFRRFQVVRVL